MNTRTSTLAGCAVFLVVVAGVAWFAFDRHQRAEAALAALARDDATVTTGIHEAETRLAAEEHDRTEIQAALTALQAKQAAAKAAASKPAGPLPPDEAVALAHDPKLMALYVRSFRAQLYERYGLIYYALNLPPDQIEKLNNLFAQQQQERMEIRAAARSQGLTDADPEITAMLQQNMDKYAAEKTALIGEDASKHWDELYKAVAFAPMLTDLTSMIALSSTPPTTQQSSDLLQILGNASAHDPTSGQALPATLDWSAALQRAQGVLSPSQFAALKVEAELAETGKLKTQYYQPAPPKN
jgi:cbb3-type cytochrome oxidase subunit 3